MVVIEKFFKRSVFFLFFLCVFLFLGFYFSGEVSGLKETLEQFFSPGEEVTVPTLRLTLTPTVVVVSTPALAYTPTPGIVTMAAVGDIMLSRTVEDRMKKFGMDYPFREVKNFLLTKDFVIGNLEAPLIEGERVAPYQMSFRAPPESASELFDSNIRIVSLANNHTYNQRWVGLETTLSILKKNDIDYIGAGKNLEEATTPVIKTIKGVTLGFLGFAEDCLVPKAYQASPLQGGILVLDKDLLRGVIPLAKSKVDLLIVSVHWGTEYKHVANVQQVEWAHFMVNLGADVILGHHPHVLQNVERYNDAIIFYSLGNFIFDQLEPNTQVGIIGEIQLSKDGVQSFQPIPITIHNLSQPRVEHDEERKRWILKPLEGWRSSSFE